MVSSADHIVEQLLAYGGIYHRYLHQDEFGPKRAEQLAALRDQLRILDLLIAQLAILPNRAREVLSNFLANKPPLPSVEQFDIAALEQLYEAAVDAKQRLLPHGDAAAISALEHLCATTEETRNSLLLLDTNTSSEIFLDQMRTRAEAANDQRTDAFRKISASIARMHHEFETTCRRLESTKGPAVATSLQCLVWELCDLWTRETSLPVTNNASRNGVYLGKPQSSAGMFVQAVVEAMQPSAQWLADHGFSETAPVRAQIIGRGAGHRARAEAFAMRRYVADHPQPGPRPGRPKAKKVTL
jgi:hypothetical protein